MATDEEIVQSLQFFLQDSNPSFTSIEDVVQQLESKLGVELTHKVDFIRSQIHIIFQQPTLAPKDQFALQQHPNFHSSGPSPSTFDTATVKQVTVPPPNAVSEVPEGAKSSAPVKPKRKGGPGGLNKLCGVSPELQVIVGQPQLPRTEIVKQLWAYIRRNNLQDPSNKRKIICNNELRVVFETDCTDMFKMNKLLAKHIIALEPSKQSAPKKRKVETEAEAEAGAEESATRSTDPGPSVVISEALAKIFGFGGREVLQAEVYRCIWEYIKVNHLEDPVNPMLILCDAKLRELFGCETISALGIPEVLTRHHLLRRS